MEGNQRQAATPIERGLVRTSDPSTPGNNARRVDLFGTAALRDRANNHDGSLSVTQPPSELSVDLLELERHLQRLQGTVARLKVALGGIERDCEATARAAKAVISGAVAVVWTPQAMPLTNLTKQECRVALCAAQGVRDGAIAAALGLSTNTVKSHMKVILRKLNLHSRWELSYVLQTPSEGQNSDTA